MLYLYIIIIMILIVQFKMNRCLFTMVAFAPPQRPEFLAGVSGNIPASDKKGRCCCNKHHKDCGCNDHHKDCGCEHHHVDCECDECNSHKHHKDCGCRR